jgi:GNAT superfamily N-acetyltransferase
LAECGQTLLGFVGTVPSRDPIDPGLGEVDTIAVAPDAWRHGIGRRLMDAAVNDLLDAGYHEAILWTLADYGQGRDFYLATGWHASGEARESGRQIAFRRFLR